MPSMLVTGSNRGLGLELARHYAREGWRVHATCRDPAAATFLAAVAGDVNLHALDVCDAPAVQRLAVTLGNEPLDLLVNNAGIYGPRVSRPGAFDFAAWRRVLDVNLLAPLRVAEAFTEHVARSAGRCMVFVSSKMGSIAGNVAGGDHPYRSSKAGLNAAVRSLAVDLRARGVCAVVVHPGWVRTDMGGSAAPLAPADSVASLARFFERLSLAHSGRFFDLDGSELPW